MSDAEEKKLAIALPGEWAIRLILGPTISEIGEDMKKLYSAGRDKILAFAYKKIPNTKDGKSANLRVTRDVLWNGSFTDESICAEYFGGILAASRSDDGKDDSGVYYVDLIKSLSSNHLRLHYLIYLSFNKHFVSDPSKSHLNPGDGSDLSLQEIFLSGNELLKITGGQDIGKDLHAMHVKGLIGDFQTEVHTLKDGRRVPYLKVSPTSLGIQLYTVAHNRLEEWRNFAATDFGNFESINSPKFRGKNIEDFLKSAGIEDREPTQRENQIF